MVQINQLLQLKKNKKFENFITIIYICTSSTHFIYFIGNTTDKFSTVLK